VPDDLDASISRFVATQTTRITSSAAPAGPPAGSTTITWSGVPTLSSS